ncbi:phage protease [Shewanella khirikhana]|uniref:Mu-like prophage I protein n=1 Tax=Shewanella khirikhana TaxID=1965282 RepID=A0ABN5TUC0_9GAMM|nr:phage protease [Shewanella khirikhana]AZQ10120.1 Mu-like prophage I protein [Shewanella khirikhana]
MGVVALCNEIGEIAPEWVQVLPGGPDIKGLDGRSWIMRDPKAVIHAFNEMKVPMVIDYEHGQEIKAPKGEEAPAAGWVEQLEIRNGEIWAKVDWTKKASNSISSREYRFLSPAFHYNSDNEIIALSSVGLTNKPNLVMQALNSRKDEKWSKYSKALGKEVSSDEELLSALNARDLDVKQKEAEQIVDGFISDAVFAPSQRDFLIACCRSQGVESFTEFASNTSGLSYLNKEVSINRSKDKAQDGLNDVQVAVCRNVGVSPERFLNIKKKEV